MYSMCCALIDTDGSAFGLLGRDGSTIQLPADSDDVEIGRYETIETTLPSGSGGVDKGGIWMASQDCLMLFIFISAPTRCIAGPRCSWRTRRCHNGGEE